MVKVLYRHQRRVDNTSKLLRGEPSACWAVEDIQLSDTVESTSRASPSKRKLIDELRARLNHLLVTLLLGKLINNYRQHRELQYQQRKQQQQHHQQATKVGHQSRQVPIMATVRPISPQYQHTLDSAISLAKELASKNMADSSEPSPKTPNSPDKKRFNFKLPKHFGKSYSEASANIRDIESSISNEARQAYKSLVEWGPYNSYTNHSPSQHSHHTLSSHAQNSAAAAHYANDDFSPSFSSSSKIKHVSASTFSLKKPFF